MDQGLFDLNLRHLRGVLAIHQTRAVSAAAKLVHLSQPALSQGVVRLEGQLGVKLFLRLHDGMQVTDAGAQIADRVHEALGHLGSALRAVRKGRGPGDSGHLFTGAQLKAVLAVADADGFAGAAALTGLSQPTLHRAVRDVEIIVGVPLVQRQGHRMILTAAGNMVARGFRLAMGAIAAGVEEISTSAGGGGTLVIGEMPRVRARILPAAIAALQKVHPEIVLTVVEGAHRELIPQLRDGRIDLAIGALRETSLGRDLDQRVLFEDHLAIIARSGHPLAKRRRPGLRELASYPWVVSPPGTPLRAQWESFFGRLAPPARINCGSVMTIRGLLLAGDYLTLLTPDQVWLELASGHLALIGDTLKGSVRRIGVTLRADWKPTRAQQSFLDILAQVSAGKLVKNQ